MVPSIDELVHRLFSIAPSRKNPRRRIFSPSPDVTNRWSLMRQWASRWRVFRNTFRKTKRRVTSSCTTVISDLTRWPKRAYRILGDIFACYCVCVAKVDRLQTYGCHLHKTRKFCRGRAWKRHSWKSYGQIFVRHPWLEIFGAASR